MEPTRVDLEHRGFDRHGSGGDQIRAAVDSAVGWPQVLDLFAKRVTAAT